MFHGEISPIFPWFHGFNGPSSHPAASSGCGSTAGVVAGSGSMGSSGGRRRRSCEATMAMALGSEERFSQEKTCCPSSVGPPFFGAGWMGWFGPVGPGMVEKSPKNGGLATDLAPKKTRRMPNIGLALVSWGPSILVHWPWVLMCCVFQVDRIGYKPSCDERLPCS